jgi:hypothetical protein
MATARSAAQSTTTTVESVPHVVLDFLPYLVPVSSTLHIPKDCILYTTHIAPN